MVLRAADVDHLASGLPLQHLPAPARTATGPATGEQGLRLPLAHGGPWTLLRRHPTNVQALKQPAWALASEMPPPQPMPSFLGPPKGR